MKTMAMLCVAAVAVIMSGCQTFGIRRFPTFAAAAPIAPKAETRCYYAGESDLTAFPAMIPMARTDSSYASAYDRDFTARRLKLRAEIDVRSDVILFFEGEPYYAGTVSSAIGAPIRGGGSVAIASSSAIYATPMIGICLRLAPAKLAVLWNREGEINVVGDKVRACGITEGDRVLSIDATPVLYGEQSFSSPHLIKALSWKPGQKVKLVWLRPDKGRMEGVATLEENPPTYMKIPALDLKRPTVQE